MGVEDVLKEIREEIKKAVPSSVEVTDVEFEAAVLVIYTKHPEKFAEDGDLVRNLAKKLRKRVVVRPDPSVLADVEKAEKGIRDIVPKEAEITDIFFETDVGEVVIEARKPGLVIGRHGETLNEIKRAVGWAPRVNRTPPIPSKTIKEIRDYLRSESEDRKNFLRRTGRRIFRGSDKADQWVRWTCLGGYREVGRSCHLLQTQESKVMIDCGVNVGNDDASTPYLHLPEAYPLTSLDAFILTHAHLDHVGYVPLLFKLGYDGPVYCTPPTRELAALLCMDYIKVAAAEGRKPPYETEHVRKMVQRMVTLKYGDTTDIAPDVKLTFQNAGHVLGSAICHIGDGLYNVALTGDIKYERTWLFNPAVHKFPRLETLIIEATYGGKNDFQPTRQEAHVQIQDIVTRTLEKKGKIIVPVFAVGRSQEVMLVLEDLVRLGKIPKMPIYLDGMIWEATAIHTAYPEYLNNKLRSQVFHDGDNPLLSDLFQRVDSYETRKQILADPGSAIVLATSGMVNGGPVMEYLKEWGPNPETTMIIVGFTAEGTLGRRLQRGLRDLPFTDKGKSTVLKLQMNVETVDGFSGHCDRRQLMNYINNVTPRPERILMMHGEESRCIDFASSVHKKYHIETRAPHNLETIRFK
ncbi:MAG: beta-CASP ribonuclease aCPSF1 [Methanobacteriota archaeon]